MIIQNASAITRRSNYRGDELMPENGFDFISISFCMETLPDTEAMNANYEVRKIE